MPKDMTGPEHTETATGAIIADAALDDAVAQDINSTDALSGSWSISGPPSWDEPINGADLTNKIELKIREARKAASARDLQTANCLFEEARHFAIQSETGPSELNILNEWGRLNLDSENYDYAETIFKSALNRTLAVLGPNAMVTAQQHNALGGLYWLQERYEECLEHYQSAFQILLEICSYFDPDTIDVMGKIGAANLQLGRYDGAEAILDRAITVSVQLHGDQTPLLPHILNTYAMVQEELGNFDKAEHFYEWSFMILRNTSPGTHNIAVGDMEVVHDNLREMRKRRAEIEG